MRLKHLLSVFLTLLTLSVGQMWGAPYLQSFNVTTSDTQTTFSSANIASGSAGRVSWTSSSVSYSTSSSGQVNFAANSSMTISVASGYVITKIETSTSTGSSTYYGSLTSSTVTPTVASSKNYTFSNINASSITINNGSTLYRITSAGWIKVYYEASSSCTDPSTLLSISSSNAATYGIDKTLETSGGNNGTVTWTVANGTGSATVSGNTLHPTSVGTVTVTATQDDNNGKCGKVVNQTITISKASASISLEDAGSGSTPSGTFYGGDSYTLPTTAATCTGKVLVGWSTVEILTEGDKPTSNYYAKGTSVTLSPGTNTFYAVYAEQGGSGTETWSSSTLASLTSSDVFVFAVEVSGTYYAMPNDEGTSSAPDLTSITVANNKITSEVPDKLRWNISGNATNGYVFYPNGSTTTWMYCNTTASSSSNDNIRVGTGSRKAWKVNNSGYLINDDNTTRYFSRNGTSDFRSYVNTNYNPVVPVVFKYSLDYTYSNYATSCCTPLGSINGSVSLTQTTATLTWDNLSNVAASNPYAVTYRTGDAAFGNANVGSITTNDQGKKTCTITGLECGTEYDFKIAVTGDGSHCDAEQVLEDKSTTKWNIEYNLSGTIDLSNGPAQGANACGDISATFSKNALYSFPATITVTIGGETATVDDYLWDASEGALLIGANKVTGNIVVAIAGVAPLNPIVTPSPDILSFEQVKKGAAVPAAQDIAITGQNLTDDLTVTSSDPTLYAVSVKSGSLTPDGDKNASPVITVTPQEGITSTAGDKNATITISGGGLTADVVVNVTFNVQETYTVNWYVNGTKIDANSKTDVEGTAVTAPSDFSTFTDCSELTFVGWKEGSAIAGGSSTAAPSLAEVVTTIPATDKNYYAVFAEGTAGGTSWNEVALANLTSSDVFVIVGNNGSTYAMTNDNGTSSAPAVATVTIANNTITSEVANNIKWNISGDATNGYTFYPNGSTTTWLYCTNTNNGVRVGTNDNKTFKPDNAGYLQHVGTSRYVGIYNSQDWRCYTAHTGDQNNIKDQNFAYYKYTEVPANWTKWYTTCPHCNAVALSKAGEADGNTFALQVSGSDVTSVKTCEAATVDVVPDPATGYELTGVALSGVAGASYDAGVITIPQDAEGTLTVTATFAQKNYSIAVETYPENIGATLGGATSTAKYGVVQTISTDEPTGYIFGGWYIYDAEDTEKETDLSEEIFTGTYEGQELELSASFLMPDKNLVAEAYFDKIYTVNEFAELSKTNNETYYIEGLICQINGFYSSKYITYLISVDGVNSGNTVLVYNGSGLNGVDFTAASDLSIGDKVIVAGKWNTSNSRINNSKQISYTAAALSALAIVGDASVTTYDVGDSFDKTGLSVTATYNTGYVVANYDATITSDYDAPTTFTAGVTSVTVSASKGLINTERVIPVTVSSAVLDHAELASGYQTEFWAKESYKEPLLNAYLNDEPATVLANVTGVTDVSGLDMSVAGDKHVTITYTRKAVQTTTVGYDFTVKPVVVDEAHAHSVSTAREIIDVDKTEGEDLDLELEGTKTHVVGVVSSVNALTGSNAGKYTIVIKDQTDANKVMTLYQVTLKSGITSVAEDDLIKAYGNLYYHTNSSKYEIDTGGEVVTVVRTPNLTVADVAEMEVNFTADLGEDDLTIDKDGSEGAITFSCSDAAVTIVNNKLHAAAAGDATVTATIAADGIYTAAETTFNVHVIEARTRYTITFDANGADGGSAPEAIADQLEGAPVELPECSYSWAKHGFTGWKVINLSTEAEVEVENNQFTMPTANVKIQAQWKEIATTHIVFNVNGNTETVTAVDVPQEVEYSITQVAEGQNGYEFVGWAENPETEDVEEAIATIESYTPEAGETSKTLYAVFKRVDEGAPKTDVLTAADMTATSTGYVEFSGVSKTSNAVYAGNSAKNDADAIQLRSKESNSGIVSTTTGGVLQSVKINVASGSNTIDVYGSNTAYSAASDLYATGNNANQGTKIGSTSSTAIINAVADYKYVGIRSNSGAIYLSSVEIVWQPKTTYYTTVPSAVYAVSYALGEGAWQEDEGCDGANVKAGKTFDICESVPVRDHYKFNGWTVGGNVVSGTITINAETEITAVWEAKVENDITYNAGTGSGSDAVVGNNEEGAEIVLPSAADKSLSKDGYDFVGWLYGGDLYEAGTTFEMPASAVTFVAQWKKQNITKMTLVTDVAQLVDGSKVVIAQAEITDDACKTMGAQGSNNRSAVASTVSGNVLSVGEGTSEFTLVSLGNNLFAFQASNGKYLYAASSGNNYLREEETLDNNGKWTISIASNGVATIKAQGTNTHNWIQYNAQNGGLFSCYGSSQKDITIYASLTAITENASISDLGYVEGDVIVVNSGVELTMDAPSAPASITVKENAVVNVTEAVEAGTVIVEKGAKLDIEEGGSVTTNEPLVLYTTLGKGTGTNTNGNAPGSSSEIINAERLNATGDVYLEIELTQDAAASAGWYAFSVPFPVDAMNGVYYGDTKLTNEVGYAIMSHYGELRAKNEYAWKKFRGIMQPGVFYVITVGNTDYKTLRFKKVKDEALVASTSVAVSPFPSQTGNNADGAWNGIGNPNLQISNLSTSVQKMQFYDHKSNSFIGRSHSVNLVVGSAFFIQYNSSSSVSIPTSTTSNEGYLAPKREQNAIENTMYELELTNVTTGEMEDNLSLTAREDATNEYEIGRDLAKMSMGTAKCAKMWVPAYGTQLCVADFPLVNDKATYPLTINAPSAGTYTISTTATENATLYLTKNGRIYWNLTMGACELDLNQGQNNEYGLVLRAEVPAVTTGVENGELLNGENGVQKVVIDEHVYILRGGEMYDMTGKMVK